MHMIPIYQYIDQVTCIDVCLIACVYIYIYIYKMGPKQNICVFTVTRPNLFSHLTLRYFMGKIYNIPEFSLPPELKMLLLNFSLIAPTKNNEIQCKVMKFCIRWCHPEQSTGYWKLQHLYKNYTNICTCNTQTTNLCTKQHNFIFSKWQYAYIFLFGLGKISINYLLCM
jgi:hypothetical protein